MKYRMRDVHLVAVSLAALMMIPCAISAQEPRDKPIAVNVVLSSNPIHVFGVIIPTLIQYYVPGKPVRLAMGVAISDGITLSKYGTPKSPKEQATSFPFKCFDLVPMEVTNGKYEAWALPHQVAEVGVYVMEYQHPWAEVSCGSNILLKSNRLVLAIVDQNRYREIIAKYVPQSSLLFASYRFRNPEFDEVPTYNRYGPAKILANLIQKRTSIEEILYLLGSPDDFDTGSWLYSLSPVATLIVEFQNMMVSNIMIAQESANPP